MGDALKRHWPEYLMEAAGPGLFMVSACLFGTLMEHPGSPVRGHRRPLSAPSLHWPGDGTDGRWHHLFTLGLAIRQVSQPDGLSEDAGSERFPPQVEGLGLPDGSYLPARAAELKRSSCL